jgi:S1-C subfamily serine protease
MKYVGFAVGLGLSLVLMIYNWPTMLSQPSPFQEARASVHQIFDHDDEHSNCSGVMVAPMRMLTAAHCIARGAPFEIGAERAPSKVLRKDVAGDVALLAVALGCPCATVATREPTQDEPVVAVGFPLNPYVVVQMLTEGRAQGAAFSDQLKGDRMRLSIPLAPGNSGGAVFAQRHGTWELVGIATNITSDSDGFMSHTMYAHLSAAATLANMHAILQPPAPPKPPAPLPIHE